MMSWCYPLAIALGVVTIVYGILEVHYFLRMGLCILWAKLIKKNVHIMDTTHVTGVCITNDVDTLLNHMNNARYLRELDFARVDFYERSRLYRTIVSKGGSVFQGAATIRYRRFIRPFSRFRIESRIIYWDDRTIFMEHQFVSPATGFVHCVALCRQRIIDCSVDDVMAILHNMDDNGKMKNAIEKIENGDAVKVHKPELPLEVSKWIEWNDLSSQKLRPNC